MAAVREATDGRGVDVVLDMVGAPYLARNLECLAEEGRLVQIGVQQGPQAELNLLAVMQRRLTVTGSTLRPRPVAEKGRIARALLANVWPKIEAGAIRPVLHARLPLARGPRGPPRDGILRPHRQACPDNLEVRRPGGRSQESSLKSILDRFLAKPEWQSPDAAVRAAAVLRLSSEERELLGSFAEDPDPRVRKAAVKKIHDPALLARLGSTDTDEGVREEAAEALLAIAVHSHEAARAGAALEGLGQPKHLLAVVRSAAVAEVRRAALGQAQPTPRPSRPRRAKPRTRTCACSRWPASTSPACCSGWPRTASTSRWPWRRSRSCEGEAALRAVAGRAKAPAASRRARARLEAEGPADPTRLVRARIGSRRSPAGSRRGRARGLRAQAGRAARGAGSARARPRRARGRLREAGGDDRRAGPGGHRRGPGRLGRPRSLAGVRGGGAPASLRGGPRGLPPAGRGRPGPGREARAARAPPGRGGDGGPGRGPGRGAHRPRRRAEAMAGGGRAQGRPATSQKGRFDNARGPPRRARGQGTGRARGEGPAGPRTPQVARGAPRRPRASGDPEPQGRRPRGARGEGRPRPPGGAAPQEGSGRPPRPPGGRAQGPLPAPPGAARRHRVEALGQRVGPGGARGPRRGAARRRSRAQTRIWRRRPSRCATWTRAGRPRPRWTRPRARPSGSTSRRLATW